eukprot:TRINITY_DN3929_c0_g1_i1.p2 TRINITY_DN3929_c0_g1~~TRINITY_DN3929_c0_g1_i1.p2  ORF type:complete len:149 (+),score=48.39 TRINITY_DN3929_c0_g1_i1:564-1010(+)
MRHQSLEQIVYPDECWLLGRFKKAPKWSWGDQQVTRRYLQHIQEQVNVQNFQDWYKVSHCQVCFCSFFLFFLYLRCLPLLSPTTVTVTTTTTTTATATTTVTTIVTTTATATVTTMALPAVTAKVLAAPAVGAAAPVTTTFFITKLIS